MRKVAYTLTGKKYGLQAGQRVALVFPNTEPVLFSCAFYGCLLSGLVPVVVEVPMSSEVSCLYCVILTSVEIICVDRYFCVRIRVAHNLVSS